MVGTIKFQKDVIQKIEEDFSKVDIPSSTRENLVRTSKIYAKYIPMSELAIRGFLILTFRDYQEKYKTRLQEIGNLSPEEQRKVVKTIADMVFEKMSAVLVNPGDKVHLRKGIDEAIEEFNKGHFTGQ